MIYNKRIRRGNMFQYTYQIQKEDINHGNHVGNERTLVFFKKAREAWLAEKNYSELSIGEGCGIIQKSACIEYRKQIFLQDTIDVNIIKIELEKLFFIFFYQIYNQKGELCVEGNTKMLAYDYKNQKVRKIPNHFLKRIEEYGM